MILLIDHRDSFTWNLAHLLAGLAEQAPTLGAVEVVQHDSLNAVDWNTVQALVLSPGPGSPADYPATINAYRQQRQRMPILGVCLGFQLILHAEGATVIRQQRILHGVQTGITFDPTSRTYNGLTSDDHTRHFAHLTVGRYHSLAIDRTTIPQSFHITAADPVDQTPLSVEHHSLPIFGLQYHPESFLSSHGEQIVRNCLGIRAI